jgi:hypothetical protein
VISFLFPMIQLVACFAFYGDDRLQNKIAQLLAAGNHTK